MLKKFISYYKPHKKIFILDMCASFLVSLIGMLYPILTRKVFKDYVEANNIEMIVLIGVCLLFLYVIRMALKFFIQYMGHVMGVKMQAQMRKDLFSHLQDLPFSYYDEHETGKMMSTLSNDLQDVSELAHHGPENIFICGVMLMGSFIYLFYINWLLALIILSCVPFLIIISLVLKKKMNHAFSESRKNIAQINASVESSISGIRVTKAFNNKNKEIEKFDKGNIDYVNSRSKAYKAMGLFQSSTNFIMDLFNVVCIISGGVLAIYKRIDIADYMTFVVSISLFMTPLTTLINFVEQLQDGISGFKRFMNIMNEECENNMERTINDLTIQGNIIFKNVSFAYQSSKEILNNVSFEIKKGEKIALVGESGGGKTTICHLLPAFYLPSSGQILIDQIDINKMTFKCLRDAIGIVQQDVFLFNGTIYENILYGKLNATKQEIYEAAKQANIYDYILSLPDGFNTKIGERGVKLSGGQKQRIAIARVFLKNPPILILDEATSALDNTTELYIQQALDKLSQGRTTIIVAHRLSTIQNANKVFVIHNGHITEEGTHQELIEKNGIYAHLYSLQFKQ